MDSNIKKNQSSKSKAKEEIIANVIEDQLSNHFYEGASADATRHS